MLDYDKIKTLAKSIKRPVTDLLALSPVNDPFYAGVGRRGQAAEWFAGMWPKYASNGAHLRRIHYRLVSPPEGVCILLPNGREYQNTENDWSFLCSAALAARYLDLVPFNGLVDRRNEEPMLFAPATSTPPRTVGETYVVNRADVDLPDLPPLPFYTQPMIPTVQDFIVEVWVEKSTQNDWLVPLCRRRGVNLVVGIGEQSEIRSRELALRAAEYGKPVRIIYLSDFDPGGRSMPKAVARKVEFTIQKFDLDVDLQLIPLALTPEQCQTYNLPRTPIKETERRKDKFEQIFGVGATELDALEALHPGEMGRLLEEEINNFLDSNLDERVYAVASDIKRRLHLLELAAEQKHADAIEDLTDRFSEIVEQFQEWEEQAAEVWEAIELELRQRRPDLSGVEIPRSEAPGETGKFILFDSRRDYFTQMDHYNAWRDGGA